MRNIAGLALPMYTRSLDRRTSHPRSPNMREGAFGIERFAVPNDVTQA